MPPRAPLPAQRVVLALRDDRLRATVVRRVPMLYRAGADAALDRGAHVRAASAAAWVGGCLAVLQDDASWIALVDPATGIADAIPLPATARGIRQFDRARGNKRDKPDLEALIRVDSGFGIALLGRAFQEASFEYSQGSRYLLPPGPRPVHPVGGRAAHPQRGCGVGKPPG